MPQIDYEVKLDFKDVLLRPRRSTLKSRSEVELVTTLKFHHTPAELTGIPIIASNMDTIGTFEMAKTLAKFSMYTAIHKHYPVSAWLEFAEKNPSVLQFVAVSAGTSESDFDKLQTIIHAIPQIKLLCLDVANGYSEFFVEFVKRVRNAFPQHIIMAGNVVTGEMVEELILSGADVVKVGIGPGSVCTTRKKAGVGYPQLSAVLECAEAAHGLGGLVISDGGCTCPGDVAKAFGAGADFVMVGGMLAGHDQCSGEINEQPDGRKTMLFYGMSSTTAMKIYHGGVADYRASEGKTVEVAYRGDVVNTIQDILGGLRSACTYTGCPHLKDLPHRTTFVRVTQQTNEIFNQETS